MRRRDRPALADRRAARPALGAGDDRAAGCAMATPLRGAVGEADRRACPRGRRERGREAVRYTIVCDAEHDGGRRRGVLRGTDVYGITAVILAEGAMRMAAPGYDRSGALAPAAGVRPGVVPRLPRAVRRQRRDRAAAGAERGRRARGGAATPARPAGRRSTAGRPRTIRSTAARGSCSTAARTAGSAVTRGAAPPDVDAEIEPLLADEADGRVDADGAEPPEHPGQPRRRAVGGARAGAAPPAPQPRVRPAAARQARPRGRASVETPFSRDSRRLMIQTLLNAFTYRDNFLRNARAGPDPARARPASAGCTGSTGWSASSSASRARSSACRSRRSARGDRAGAA